MAQGKYWVFTLNADETKGEQVAWIAAGTDCPVRSWMDCSKLDYLVCQVERAPETGHIHVQGYCQFSGNMRLSALKKINKEAHWEIRRGNHKQAKDYCMKEESRVAGPWELGTETVSEQGKRNDLKNIYEQVKAKKTNSEMLESTEGAAAKFSKHIQFMRFTLMEQESDRQLQGVKVITLYGPTGKGKTYSAVNFIAGCKDYYICEAPSHKDSKLWFDGYEGQRYLILDDFEGSFCSFRYILRLLDKYKLKIEVKGGFSWATWTTVIITSNIHPSGWYTAVDTAPLKRRLTEDGSEIRLITEQGVYKRVDWAENLLDEDDQSFLPSRPSSPAPAADTTTTGDYIPSSPPPTPLPTIPDTILID